MSPDAERVEEVKQICRADIKAKVQWCTWCDQNAAGTKDPNRMTTDQLDAFLSDYQAGSVSGWSTSQATRNNADASSKVDEVKNLCRADLKAKAQWCAWCDINSSGTKDPSRMSPQTLDLFLKEFYSGVTWDGAAGGEAKRSKVSWGGCGDGTGSWDAGSRGSKPQPEQHELSEVVKLGQRVSPSWKAAWAQFAQENGGGTYDPSKHETDLLISFFEFLGAKAAGPQRGGGRPTSAAMPMSVTAPSQGPSKRTRVELIARGGASEDPGFAEMVQRVRELQKTDPTKKQQWSDFCDSIAGGTKDPNRHSADTLTEFLQMYDA